MNDAADAESAARLVQRAEALLALKRPAEAVRWLRRALATDPHHYAAHCHLALAHYRLRQYDQARRAAEQATLTAPEAAWPHSLRALALLALDQKGPAVSAAGEAVRLEPDAAEALYALGYAQAACGKSIEARATAERLREIAPENPRAYEVLTLVALNERRWREAEMHCRQALALDPESVGAQLNLGVALENQWRGREAVDVVRDAARHSPDDQNVHAHLFRAVSSFNERLPALPSVLLLLGYIAGVAMLAINLWLAVALTMSVGVADILYRKRRVRDLGPSVAAFFELAQARLKRKATRRQWLIILAVWTAIGVAIGIVAMTQG